MICQVVPKESQVHIQVANAIDHDTCNLFLDDMIIVSFVKWTNKFFFLYEL